ncbi:hypothetical protein VW603_002022 [Salmonella enterica]|nr:hypothetical protein [Salmonella enterica]
MVGLALIRVRQRRRRRKPFWPGLVVASGMLTGNLFTMFVLPTVCVWLARDCDGMSERSSLSSAQRSAYSSFAVVVVYFFALKSARHVALFIKHQNQST